MVLNCRGIKKGAFQNRQKSNNNFVCTGVHPDNKKCEHGSRSCKEIQHFVNVVGFWRRTPVEQFRLNVNNEFSICEGVPKITKFMRVIAPGNQLLYGIAA